MQCSCVLYVQSIVKTSHTHHYHTQTSITHEPLVLAVCMLAHSFCDVQILQIKYTEVTLTLCKTMASLGIVNTKAREMVVLVHLRNAKCKWPCPLRDEIPGPLNETLTNWSYLIQLHHLFLSTFSCGLARYLPSKASLSFLFLSLMTRSFVS